MRLYEFDIRFRLKPTSNISIIGTRAGISYSNSEFATTILNAWDELNSAVLTYTMLPGIDFYLRDYQHRRVGDIERFADARKLTSWAGLVPSLRQSGSTSYMGKITKRGSKWLRWILVQAAQEAVINDDRLGRYYERVARRRGHHKAIVAVAREMLTIIYHMLRNKEEYRGKNLALTERKYKRMERIASK